MRNIMIFFRSGRAKGSPLLPFQIADPIPVRGKEFGQTWTSRSHFLEHFLAFLDFLVDGFTGSGVSRG